MLGYRAWVGLHDAVLYKGQLDPSDVHPGRLKVCPIPHFPTIATRARIHFLGSKLKYVYLHEDLTCLHSYQLVNAHE
jgi:hypothetical protein